MIDGVPLHGGQLCQIAERFGIPVSQLIDFSANINPDGPPASALSSLRASLEDPRVLTDYPDLDEKELKRAIAGYVEAPTQSIVVANGFIPLLECALRTLRIRSCLVPVPAFVEYRRTLERADVAVIPHPVAAESNCRYEIDSMLASGHDAILLANPQNPSGVLTRGEVLRDLVRQAAERKITVLLDEAFIDYVPIESLKDDVAELPNLIVFRSVTKFHGIPGLRVAYAIANKLLAAALTDGLPPWSITTLAARGVAAALAEEGFGNRTRLLNESRKVQLRVGLEGMGISTYASAANFLLVRLPSHLDAASLWERLIVDHHVVLRNCANYEGLTAGHLRAAVRTQEQNRRLLAAVGSAIW